MSPSRTRKPVVRSRPRSDMLIAVAVGAAIVLGTVLLVWLLRPGGQGEQGSGGLFARQPRATLFVLVTAAVLGGAIWWILRHRLRRIGPTVAIVLSCVVVLGGAAVAAALWPGGVIHHWTQAPNIPASPPPAAPTTATTKTTPTTKAASPPTTKPR